MITLIFLNLFIAIIIDQYQQTVERNQQMFDSEIKEQFRDVWSKFDQDAISFIKVEDFPEFMFALPPPLGWDESYKEDNEKQ